MRKLKQIGGLSFGSEEAYNNFLSLPREEQVKQVSASFSPQDESRAIEALKGVKNGDSSATTHKATTDNPAEGTGTDTEGNTGEPAGTNGGKKSRA